MAQLIDLHSCTFPQLLMRHAVERSGEHAMRVKRRGIWHTWSWHEVAQSTRSLASGLKSLGFVRGDRIAVLGNNHPRLYWSMFAAQMLGGVAIPLSGDMAPDALAKALVENHVRFAVAGGQAECDKLLAAEPAGLGLLHILINKIDGRQGGRASGIYLLDDVLKDGCRLDREDPSALDREIAAGCASDLSIILPFPSINPDPPLGEYGGGRPVQQTHAEATHGALRRLRSHGFDRHDEVLSYLPLGSWADHHFSFAVPITGGLTVSFPESPDTVAADVRELGPTLHVVPARAADQLRVQTLARLKDAGPLRKLLFNTFLREHRHSASTANRIEPLGWLGDVLVRAPLLDVLGLSRVKKLFVDGNSLNHETTHFFQTLGVKIEFAGIGSQAAKPETAVPQRLCA